MMKRCDQSNHCPISVIRLTAIVLLMMLTLSGCQGGIRPESEPTIPLIKPTQAATTVTANSKAAGEQTTVASESQDPKMRICFTFDDGPDPKSTPMILDLLKKHNIKAAFFVIGSRVDANPGIITRMAAEGHLILNHTYSHPLDPDMTQLSDKQMRQEIDKADAAIEKITHVHSAYFRAPGGALNDRIKAFAGRPIIQWSVEGGDWYLTDASQIFDNIFPKLKNDTIILMHDNHAVTVDALDRLLDAIPPDRFEILLLDDYLAQGGK